MEIAKLILEYLKALAWPVIALIIALLYKKQVVAVLGRLKKAGLPGGVSLDFSEGVQEVRQLSAAVVPIPPKPEHKKYPAIPLTEANARMISLGLQPSPSGLDMSFYRTLALQDPNIALAGIRIEIDILARNLAKGFKVPSGERDSGMHLLGLLLQKGSISQSQFDLTEKVLRLCNAAIHGTIVSREQAEAVIDSAEVLAAQYLDWLRWGFPDGWTPSSKDVGSRKKLA